MASLILLDTHVAAWLYAGLIERIPAPARAAIEQASTVGVSPLVALELQYLHEIERLNEPASTVLVELEARVGLEVIDCSLAELIAAARQLSWTRDPFDRLITAQAIITDAPLVTGDRTIHEHLSQALWD